MIDDHFRQSRQNIIIGLILTTQELYPEEQLKISYSILNGIYFELDNSPLSSREVTHIEEGLEKWIARDIPIQCVPEPSYYSCTCSGKTIQTLYPSFDSSGKVDNFKLVHYPPGFILLLSRTEENTCIPTVFIPPKKLSATFKESQQWVEKLQLSRVNEINAMISEGHAKDLVLISEAVQEKYLSNIADVILRSHDHLKIILISGPSSSGKTTFTQRLSVQLRVNGLQPVPISLDDYFLAREDTPLDEHGQPDFESLYALDLQQLNSDLQRLIKGERVDLPVFDFFVGRRKAEGRPLQLNPDHVLVIEGIHGLNPNLIPSFDQNQLYKIYISAIFPLNLDFYNHIPTTETRLIRRIVRDNQFRGSKPDRTLSQWDSVRRGETNYIFPYQEEANVMFNSSLLYELNALRPFAEPLLQAIPEVHIYHTSAQRLLRLLSFFVPVDVGFIPSNSLLREFTGGSLFYT
ncbi:MAG: nucleoside kinase [Peptococcaceae bacterium]|jgi:uridine kinase|nr:nucleoside kinase [Peptococcaceae bacterium]